MASFTEAANMVTTGARAALMKVVVLFKIPQCRW
jgi:hypothetical protein